MIPFDRRKFLGAGAAAAGLAFLSAPTIAKAAPPAATTLSPAEALSLLMAGNARFVANGAFEGPIGSARRAEIAGGQAPFATILTCSDSRVSPELLFSRGLGEIFVVRNAGNTAASDQAFGSIEYAVAELKTPLIVVLGHERCGAVAAALSVVRENARLPGMLGPMVEPILPAVLAVRDTPEAEMLPAAIHQNVREVATNLRMTSSPLISPALKSGRAAVVGAYYDLDTGAVNFFDRG